MKHGFRTGTVMAGELDVMRAWFQVENPSLARIQPLERYTKSAYAEVPKAEREQRARAAKYWEELRNRPHRLEPTTIEKHTQ